MTEEEKMKALEKEIFEETLRCSKCRMCVNMCPTYEGWFTQGSVGRLMAIHYFFKYGLGSEEELSNLLFSCTTCRRCEERCKMLATGVSPTDTIIKARQLLVKRAQAKEAKSS